MRSYRYYLLTPFCFYWKLLELIETYRLVVYYLDRINMEKLSLRVNTDASIPTLITLPFYLALHPRILDQYPLRCHILQTQRVARRNSEPLALLQFASSLERDPDIARLPIRND
jgi:hypothetical protein